MFRDFTRAQQRLLHLSGPLRSRPDGETGVPESIVFSPEAIGMLHTQVYATGSVRGGPLFGSLLEGEVTVMAAITNGMLALGDTLRYDPLRVDSAYVLGWSESLALRYDGQVDWIGHWIMQADGLLGSTDQERSWFRRGLSTDLFNERNFLACVGWVEGILETRIYLVDPITNEVLMRQQTV